MRKRTQINPWRGEVKLTLGGVDYVLRPSFQALCAIEQILATGFFTLAEQVAQGALTLPALVEILAACSDEPAPVWEEAIMRSGVAPAMAAVAEMFVSVFEGFSDGDRFDGA